MLETPREDNIVKIIKDIGQEIINKAEETAMNLEKVREITINATI